MHLTGLTMTTYWSKHVAVLSFASTQQIFVLTASVNFLLTEVVRFFETNSNVIPYIFH